MALDTPSMREVFSDFLGQQFRISDLEGSTNTEKIMDLRDRLKKADKDSAAASFDVLSKYSSVDPDLPDGQEKDLSPNIFKKIMDDEIELDKNNSF